MLISRWRRRWRSHCLLLERMWRRCRNRQCNGLGWEPVALLQSVAVAVAAEEEVVVVVVGPGTTLRRLG